MCWAVIYKGRGGRELSIGAYTGGGDHERVGCAELSADEKGQPRKESLYEFVHVSFFSVLSVWRICLVL